MLIKAKPSVAFSLDRLREDFGRSQDSVSPSKPNIQRRQALSASVKSVKEESSEEFESETQIKSKVTPSITTGAALLNAMKRGFAAGVDNVLRQNNISP